MARRKLINKNFKCKTSHIPYDILSTKFTLPYNKSGTSNKKYLLNSDDAVTLTRQSKKFTARSISNMLYALTKQCQSNFCNAEYMSRYSIYKICKNEINRDFYIITKPDDAQYISWSRFGFIDSFNLYLFSIINEDCLNLNTEEIKKNNNEIFVSDFVNKHFKEISNLQYLLRNAILLDAFLKGIDDAIIEHDKEYRITQSNAILTKSEIETMLSSKIHDEKLDLCESISPAIAFFMFLDKHNTSEEVSLNNLLTQNTFLSKKYQNAQFTKISSAFDNIIVNALAGKSIDIYDALSLFHINRYTHILDPYLMGVLFRDSDSYLPLYKIGGTFTSMILSQITKNMYKKISDDFTSKNSNLQYSNTTNGIIPSISANENFITLYDRDYIFIASVINRTAEIFKELFFSKPSKNDNRVVFDYSKLNSILKAFQKDTALNSFLETFTIPAINSPVNFRFYSEICDYMRAL